MEHISLDSYLKAVKIIDTFDFWNIPPWKAIDSIKISKELKPVLKSLHICLCGDLLKYDLNDLEVSRHNRNELLGIKSRVIKNNVVTEEEFLTAEDIVKDFQVNNVEWRIFTNKTLSTRAFNVLKKTDYEIKFYRDLGKIDFDILLKIKDCGVGVVNEIKDFCITNNIKKI